MARTVVGGVVTLPSWVIVRFPVAAIGALPHASPSQEPDRGATGPRRVQVRADDWPEPVLAPVPVTVMSSTSESTPGDGLDVWMLVVILGVSVGTSMTS